MNRSVKVSGQPLLTVATVCFNVVKGGRAAAFRNCISSVRSQTLRSIEHLIVDGGSRDGTCELVRDCGPDDNCRVISEPDHGIYDAMNKAIRLARGEYICFVNTDDAFSDVGAVDVNIRALKREKADFSFANADVYSADHASFLRNWRSSIDDMPFGFYPCHQTLFCKTSVLREVGGFTENFLANDNLLMLKLVARDYSCIYLDRTIIDFHDGGASVKMIADKERMQDEHIDFFMREFGKKAGLTVDDCRWLYDYRYRNMPYAQLLDLGSRLVKPRWIKRYFSILLADRMAQIRGPSASQARARLFGKLPLFGVDIPV